MKSSKVLLHISDMDGAEGSKLTERLPVRFEWLAAA